MCNHIVPKIAILTFIVSTIAIVTLFYTFDYFLEIDIKKAQEKKVKDEFYHLSSYVQKQQNQLLLLAHEASQDKHISYIFEKLDQEPGFGRSEFDRWAMKYNRINTKLHDLDSLTIWSKDDGLLASTDEIIGNMTVNLSNYSITQSRLPQSGIIKLGEELWIVSIAPIYVEGFKFGSIQFSRNISNKFKNEVSIVSDLRLTTLDGLNKKQLDHGDRLVLANTIDGKQIYIEPAFSTYDDLRNNNTRIYTIIMIILISVSLFSIFVIILRRETLPFKGIEALFKQVDEAKFGKKVTPNICTEAQAIYKAYDDVLLKLQCVKEKEVMLNQKSKLVTIGNLAARVSHDINNPLSVIRSIADIGRRNECPSPQQVMADMDKIYAQTDRCMDISHNLLNVSKKVSSNVKAVNIKQYMEDYLVNKQMLEPEFQYQIIDDLEDCDVIVNSKACSQILDILLKNAMEANNNQLITIRLFKTQSWGVVEITDNGVGFSSLSQEEVFDLFFTTKAKGHGIGLSNALSLANSMDGTIRVTDAAKGQISVYSKLVKPEDLNK